MNLSSALKRTSTMFDKVARPRSGVVVLIYHRVGGGSSSQVDLDPTVFDAHLAHLAEHHHVVTLDHAVRALTAGEPLEGVVITFDDGTTDFLDYTVPALVRHGLPATLYAATAYIDSGERFPWDAPPVSWAGLREATATGLVTVGSHTHTHALLDRLSPADMCDDLDRSIELIGSNLGVVPSHFAYPKAVPGSPAAEVAVRRRFSSAALAGSRVNRSGHVDVHRLHRTPVQRSDGQTYFEAKARGGMRLEGRLRAVHAGIKYRGDTR